MRLRRLSIAFATTGLLAVAPPAGAAERNLAPIVEWATHSSQSRHIAADPVTAGLLGLSDTRYVATGVVLGSDATDQELRFGVVDLQPGRAIFVGRRVGSQLLLWHVSEDGQRITSVLVNLAVKSTTRLSNSEYSAEYERTLETFFERSSSR